MRDEPQRLSATDLAWMRHEILVENRHAYPDAFRRHTQRLLDHIDALESDIASLRAMPKGHPARQIEAADAMADAAEGIDTVGRVSLPERTQLVRAVRLYRAAHTASNEER